MSPKRFTQYIAKRFPVPTRAVLVAVGLFIALAGFASLLLLLSSAPAPALAGPAEDTDLPSAEAAPAVSVSLLANNTRTQIQSDNPDPSVVGQGVYVAFRVDSDPYAGVTPYGWVTVTNGVNTCGRHCLSTDDYCPSYWTAWWWGCTITPLSAGAQTITATFTPQFPLTYTSSFDTDSHTVNKADTSTAIASGPPSPKVCDTIVLTATVTVKSPGSGTPTGTVTFFDGDVSLGTATLSSGKATYTVSSLSAGQHFFSATYNGDDNYNPSDSTALAIKPASLTPSVSLSASPASPQTFGTVITLTATITGATCVTPTGHVYFNDNGVVIGTGAITTTNRTATLVVPLLSAGSHLLKAVYESDNDAYLDSESASQTYVINRRSTTTTLVSSANPSVWGQTVTFTATVSAGIAVTPTGQVILWDGGTVIGSGTLDGSGRAVISTADLEVGSHPMTANYQGDENFLPGSGSLTQTVNKANTTTSVVSCVPNSSRYGESVMCTARVTPVPPGAGTPTGQIVFSVDGIPVYTTALGFGTPGEATYTTSPGDATTLTPAGNHNVTATYGGDNHFTCTTCTSPNYVQTVQRADTQVNLQAPLTTVDFGQQVQITAIVSAVPPGAGTITGKVVFSVNATPVYTKTLDGTTPSATYSTNSLPIGTNTVCAQYLHDTNPNFNNSPQVCVTITVNKAQSKTSLTSAPNPSLFGQMAVFSATVTPAGASTSTITPTGTVTFTFNSTGFMTGTLNSLGVASVATDTLPVGIYNVTADYGGDGNFLPSSATRQHTVNQNPTTTTLTLSPPSPAAVGTLVTFTAIVSSTGGVTPTGTVKFWDGLTVLGSGALNASGVATFSTAALAAGSHSLKASYDGTPEFSPSSSARQTYVITAAGSTTTLTSSQNPSVYGQNVTFQATVTAAGTPTGQVTFKDGAATLGTAPLVSGVATFSTAASAVGTHPITAVYGGDANFAGSTSNQVDQVVNKANTTTTITSDLPDPSVVGQPVVVNFTVVANAPGSGTPTGNVTVDDGTASCTGSVAAGTCTLTPTTAGAKTLTATYAGDANFNGSSDNTQTHQVNKADTTTTVTSSPNPSLPGQNVTLTANVTANPPGAGTPTGQVQFKSNGTPIGGPVALVGGSASVNTSFASEGTYNITADYTNLDGNFINSSGATTHNVSATPTDLSVTKADSPDPVNVGENLTYVIVVTNHGPESTTVTLTDALPSQVFFVSATPSQGSCSGTSTVTCNLGNMNNGGSATVTIIVTVPITTPAGTVLRNTARVSGTRPEPVPDPHPNTATQETTVYRSFSSGDCNGDDAVDLADIWAIVRRIFDPTFQGTSGCDANQDRRVDAGDVPSTVLIMFREQRTREQRTSPALLPGPALTMPGEVQAYGGLATVPVAFAANGHSITSLAFSVDYDETWLALNPTDRDGNGVPDAVVFSLPGDFTYSVTFDEDDTDGEVDIFIGDITPPLTSLSDGPIVVMLLDADSSPGSRRGAVRFSLDPVASFGDTSGQSIPGTATPGREHRIYLPVVLR